MTDEQKRMAMLFREKPFLVSLMYPRIERAMIQELVLQEVLRDNEMYHMIFGLKEVSH